MLVKHGMVYYHIYKGSNIKRGDGPTHINRVKGFVILKDVKIRKKIFWGKFGDL